MLSNRQGRGNESKILLSPIRMPVMVCLAVCVGLAVQCNGRRRHSLGESDHLFERVRDWFAKLVESWQGCFERQQLCNC